ncbi:MAG: hypothetical protein LIO96_13455 [Lachnospiraceae bacterium]|nr:hypothetical protein [Lachnospiraceae bacterium]
MDYAEFEKQITEKVLELYGDGYLAHIDDGIVENGTGKRSLFIAKAGRRLLPRLYFWMSITGCMKMGKIWMRSPGLFMILSGRRRE